MSKLTLDDEYIRLKEALKGAQVVANRAKGHVAENIRLQKAFALACRHLYDEMGLASSGPELQRGILDRVDNERVCRLCGCTENNACVGVLGDSCSWASEDLCSACAGKDGNNGTIK